MSHLRLTLCIAVALIGTAPLQATASAPCDLQRIAGQAERAFPAYTVEAQRADTGTVILQFRPRGDSGMLAIALRARGTQLATSVAATGIGDAEITRVAAPVAEWWRDAELQRALAACSAGPLDPTELARVAAAALQRTYRDVPLRATYLLGAAWIILAVLLGALLWRMTRRAERIGLLALFAAACVVDAALDHPGPGDLRLNLGAIWSPIEVEMRWGPAPVALFRLADLGLGGSGDRHIRAMNLVLSSVVPILLYGFLARLGIGRAARHAPP